MSRPVSVIATSTPALGKVFFAPLERTAASNKTNDRVISALELAGIPVVLLDRCFLPYPNRSRHDLVGIDHRRAGYMITEHLLRAGCRRIAFVAYSNSASTVAARIAGYREALFAAGVPVEPASLQRLNSDDESEVRRVMETLKPEAIVGANDRTAGHLMHGLIRLGYRVPEDVRIVGIDDVEYANLLPVPLTTVHQPCRQIGEHFKPGARKSRGGVHRIGWPVMEHDSQPEAYCVHVWIRGIHPMLWRRFLVRSDSTLEGRVAPALKCSPSLA